MLVLNSQLAKTKFTDNPNIRWYILTNTLVGAFMANLDSSIVNVALPTIAGKMHVNISVIQWVVTAYLLAVTSSLLIFGRLADLIGRKKVFSSGFLIFYTWVSFLCHFTKHVVSCCRSGITIIRGLNFNGHFTGHCYGCF